METTPAPPEAKSVPEGFAPHFRKSPLTDPWEPLYSKRSAGAVIMGLRLAEPHTNARGLIHGGLIAALCDNAMGYSCSQRLGEGATMVTVGLAVDFVGTAKIGQWLSFEPEIVKTGNTLCFAQCIAKADGVAIARANATFKVLARKE